MSVQGLQAFLSSQLSGDKEKNDGLSFMYFNWSVADPGFPRGGGANSPGGAPTYDFAKFSQKLHEIERIWAPGGARPSRPPLDPPLLVQVCAYSVRYKSTLAFWSSG